MARAGNRAGFFAVKKVPFSGEERTCNFRRIKATRRCAGRAIVQACAHDGPKERRLGDRKLRSTCGFAVFSLFGFVIFGRIAGFTRLYMDFPIRPAPLQGFTDTCGCTALGCTPWLRHDN